MAFRVVKLGSRTFSVTSLALKVCLGLLMIDAIIQVSLASSTIAWLHDTASRKSLHFVARGSKHHIPMLPRDFMTEYLHVCNGAAGTAFAIVGLGSIVALRLRDWVQYRQDNVAARCRQVYLGWISCNMAALLLTGVAVAYVYGVIVGRAGQKISVNEAINLNGRPYDLNNWTADGWFSAVLQLKLLRDRADIEKQLRVMRAGQYNLPAMFLFQSGVTVLGYIDYNDWAIKSPGLDLF